MTPKPVDRTARREEILAAAVRVFARRGYAASRVEDVAREAGIAKGSVYLYFRSREELLEAAFQEFVTRSAAMLEEATTGSGSATERLERLVRSVLTALTRESDLARVLVDAWAAGRGSSFPVDMAGFYRQYREAITTLLTQAAVEGTHLPAEPAAHAAILVGAIEGCLLQWLLDPGLDLAELADPMVALLVPAGARQ